MFGFIGFIGNAFTYLQAELRSNTCCIYLLCGSFIDIITLFLNLFPSYLSKTYAISIPWNTSSALCKMKLFLLTFLPHLSINFLLMSTIDRFASTCRLGSIIRRLNQLKILPWTIIITIIYSCLTSIQAPILFDLTFTSVCQATNPTSYSILYIVFNGLISPLIMLVFILLTNRNIRLSRRRVGAANATIHRRSRNQFVIMIFCQVLATEFFLLQWIITYTYYLIITNDVISNWRLRLLFLLLQMTAFT